MKSTMRSFRSLEPSEGHPMLATSWSPTGERAFSTANAARTRLCDGVTAQGKLLTEQPWPYHVYIVSCCNIAYIFCLPAPDNDGAWHLFEK